MTRILLAISSFITIGFCIYSYNDLTQSNAAITQLLLAITIFLLGILFIFQKRGNKKANKIMAISFFIVSGINLFVYFKIMF
ncbi:hypothetical protein [Bacillus sp. JKS001846]|uniref:hypothetical protein n=1 Tax=Bacillus sp. JKS001846 TaxID=1938743 RepID=UPI0009D88EF1|nr:hypothetical protein [Bacillus sp. JKS001846]SMD41133.1 hypothetical protein SAMN06272738_5818 [Bacillus sp. JKS001846]